MKQIIAGVLLVASLLAFTGCSSKQEQATNPIVDACKQVAQQHIDNGDIESAIQVLEEGFAATKDPTIRSLLEQFKTMASTQATDAASATDTTMPSEETNSTETTNPTFSVDSYLGSWSNTYCQMDIARNADLITLNMVCISYRVVEFELTLSTPIPSLESNKLEFPFDDDGLGNQGTVVLYLDSNNLNYVISDYIANSDYGIQTSYGGGSLTRTQSNTVSTNSGDYDDVAGLYIDTSGAFLPMAIGYEDASKEIAYAQISLPSPIEGVTVTLGATRDSNAFWGSYDEINTSDPTCTVEFQLATSGNITANIEYWLDTGLYKESFIFEPVADGTSSFSNPFFTD